MSSRSSPGSPLSAKPGALRCGRGEGRVAEAAAAALRRDEPGARRRPGRRAPGRRRRDHGAVGHLERPGRRRRRRCGWSPRPGWPLAALRAGAVEVEQRGHAGVHLEDHAAAAAAVAAVGAAERLELLPVDRGAAMAAVARLHVQRPRGPRTQPSVCPLIRHPSVDMRQWRAGNPGPPSKFVAVGRSGPDLARAGVGSGGTMFTARRPRNERT